MAIGRYETSCQFSGNLRRALPGDQHLINLKYIPHPTTLRLSAWYVPSGGEDAFGSAGGRPGFMIRPDKRMLADIPGTQCFEGEVGETINNLPNAQYYVNGGTIYLPWPATIECGWPDVDARNQGVLGFELISQPSAPPQAWPMSYTHWLRNGESFVTRREVRGIAAPYAFAAVEIDGIQTHLGELPSDLGGEASLKMVFLPGIPASIQRLPVRCHY